MFINVGYERIWKEAAVPHLKLLPLVLAWKD